MNDYVAGTDYVTGWKSGLPETPCGKGSMFAETGMIREYIPEIIQAYDIETIADVGCGDQNWIHKCLPENIEYVGFDIMPRRADVKTFDVCMEVLPEPFDLVICLFVLNHLRQEKQVERALRLLKESGAKYLLCSFHNKDTVPFLELDKKFIKHQSGLRWYYGLWRMN